MVKKDKRKEAFLEHLKTGKGIISYACDMTGISRRTFYNWKNEDDEFAKRVEDVNEETLDIVESKLLSAISDDNLTAIIFYLKTKGRNRGYVERVENEVDVNSFERLMKELPD